MVELRIIKGTLEETQAKQKAKDEKIKQAYKRILTERKSTFSQILKVAIKYVNKYTLQDIDTAQTYEEALQRMENSLSFIMALDNLISSVNLKTFKELFPIDKYYSKDGMIKDYYSTIECIKELGIQEDEFIGENVDELLNGYANNEIIRYQVVKMMLVTKYHRMTTGEDLLMNFFEDQGLEVDTFSKLDENTMINNNTGEISKIVDTSKPKLRVIKGGKNE